MEYSDFRLNNPNKGYMSSGGLKTERGLAGWLVVREGGLEVVNFISNLNKFIFAAKHGDDVNKKSVEDDETNADTKK